MAERDIKKRDMNATEEQKQLILNFMEENIDFGRGKLMESVEGKKKHNALWDVLTQSLNCTAGPIRETAKWQRFWSDMKMRVKKKSAEMKKSREITGGGLQNPIILSDLEERILFFVSPEAAYGVRDPEFNITLESDIPVKKQRTDEDVDQIKEYAETSEFDISSPNTPISDVESMVSPRSSTSHQRVNSSSKKKKVITSSDVTTLLQQQSELNMRLTSMNTTLNNIQFTLEQSSNHTIHTNQLLERIALALEKLSDC